LECIAKNEEVMIEVKETPSKGKGVYAAKAFKKGEVVLVKRIIEECEGNHEHAAQYGSDRFVVHDEVSQCVNHSCEPNCGVRVDDSGSRNLVAMRNIAEGEEINFDYAMENYTIDHFPSQCMCGSPHCRGRITGWKDLPKEKKEEYRPWAAPYLLELDALNEAQKNPKAKISTNH
jgi:SET domain-containing protein